MQTDNYISKSLELHLFFGRIMKEHALFLRAGFTPVNGDLANQAAIFQAEFENLLCQALELSCGMITPHVLRSGELVTEFTATAEKQTEHFTGISINRDITAKELCLNNGCRQPCGNRSLRSQIQRLNQKAQRLLDGLIAFKETILRKILCCELFTMNYPLLIEHIIREAKLYRQFVCDLESDGALADSSMRDTERFWNQIMMEHAQFIRGLLDPCETELFCTADKFAAEYAALLENCDGPRDNAGTAGTLAKTAQFRDFKRVGVQGIQQCKIRSVILPLLADHVLREANHYLRLLKCGESV